MVQVKHCISMALLCLTDILSGAEVTELHKIGTAGMNCGIKRAVSKLPGKQANGESGRDVRD